MLKKTLKPVANRLYFLKKWYQDVFTYPKERLSLNFSQDYDVYWQEKRKFWEERAGTASGVLTSWQKERAEVVKRSLLGKGEISLGDIGCGEGTILKYLVEGLPVTRAIGFDSSEVVSKLAESVGIEVREFDMNKKEDFKKLEKLDYYLLLEVLEHTPHSEVVLDAAYQTSLRGVFFSFPNSGFFIYRLRLLFGKFPKQWVTFPNEHLRFWTAADLKWWLKALGYKKYAIFYYKGVPLLNRIWPSLFAAGFVVRIEK